MAAPGPGLLSARGRTCSKGTCVSHTLSWPLFAHVPSKVGPLMHNLSWGEEAGPWQHALITVVLRLLPLPSVALAQFAFICLWSFAYAGPSTRLSGVYLFFAMCQHLAQHLAQSRHFTNRCWQMHSFKKCQACAVLKLQCYSCVTAQIFKELIAIRNNTEAQLENSWYTWSGIFCSSLKECLYTDIHEEITKLYCWRKELATE